MHYELCIDIASCTTSVYVNLSKNTFFFKPQPRFLGESECKGTTIINTIQILKQKNSQKHESFRESLQISNTHYIY